MRIVVKAAAAAVALVGLVVPVSVGSAEPPEALLEEPVCGDEPDAAIWAIFGFTMTIPLDQRVLLR